MYLTDAKIKAARPGEKAYKLSDGDGLTLLIQPNGSKWWRYRYRYDGKEKMLSVGTYPDVTLKEARTLRAASRDLLKQGIDPSQHRKQQKHVAIAEAENSFESVARQWWNHWKHARTERHAAYTLRRLETDVFPMIGDKQINSVMAMDLLATIKKIESRGATDIAKRALSTCGQIFRYAVGHGLAERNPAADIKPADVLKRTQKTNYARLNHKDLPELLRRIDQYDGHPLTRFALKLIALTFVRTGELIGARWEEIDIAARQWRIPAERMKMRAPHIVPLADQAIEVLQDIRRLRADEVLLFPSERRNGQFMSNNTLLYALYRMGYHSRMTGHGFRGIASTILHEQGYAHEHIELQLAHSPRDEVSASYNHALYLEPRARMMQDWADYLDRVKNGR